jgi:hypothetical protein
MDRMTALANGERNGGHARVELSSAALFALLWKALADLLGSAAAATLLRRAARRAMTRSSELAELAIVRENLEYRYALPPAWSGWTGSRLRALRHLVGELLPLLEELTGSLVVNHLAQIPELREWGIVPPQEEGP